MNRILNPVATVVVAAAALAAPALAATPATTTTTTAAPTPVQGSHMDVMLYVDTVQSTHPKYGVNPAIGCSITNYFQRGNGVVFRVWGVETSTGNALTTSNVKYAYVKVPNPANAASPTIIKLNYGAHGTGATARAYWTAAWDVAPDYPLGVVPFRVVFRTVANKFGQFDQNYLPAPSQLTITP